MDSRLREDQYIYCSALLKYYSWKILKVSSTFFLVTFRFSGENKIKCLIGWRCLSVIRRNPITLYGDLWPFSASWFWCPPPAAGSCRSPSAPASPHPDSPSAAGSRAPAASARVTAHARPPRCSVVLLLWKADGEWLRLPDLDTASEATVAVCVLVPARRSPAASAAASAAARWCGPRCSFLPPEVCSPSPGRSHKHGRWKTNIGFYRSSSKVSDIGAVIRISPFCSSTTSLQE